MGVFGGPNVSEDGLVLALDAANQKCISPLGCTGFNNAPQLVKNIISQLDTINSYNSVKLGNLNYYTAFAIDYPESSYGGDGASRQGITPGFNVRSGAQIFGFGRALNYAVYNNITQSWVKTTIYDTYAYSSEVDRFVSEYATAVTTYPDAVHLVAGSHRDSNHSAAQYNILRDLGAPSNVDSIIGFSSPEWILVGKPGLGAGNAFGWVFQNYSTNPDQVAHLNFGLPIYGNVDNYLKFDGTNEYIQANVNTNALDGDPTFSVDMFVRRRTGTNIGAAQAPWGFGGTGQGNGVGGWTPTTNLINLDFYDSTRLASTEYYPEGQFVHIAWTKNGAGAETSNVKCYVNGVERVLTKTRSATRTNQFNTSTNGVGVVLGRLNGNSGDFHAPVDVASFKVYTRALSAAEVSQNFIATRSRYGI